MQSRSLSIPSNKIDQSLRSQPFSEVRNVWASSNKSPASFSVPRGDGWAAKPHESAPPSAVELPASCPAQRSGIWVFTGLLTLHAPHSDT